MPTCPVFTGPVTFNDCTGKSDQLMRPMQVANSKTQRNMLYNQAENKQTNNSQEKHVLKLIRGKLIVRLG